MRCLVNSPIPIAVITFQTQSPFQPHDLRGLQFTFSKSFVYPGCRAIPKSPPPLSHLTARSLFAHVNSLHGSNARFTFIRPQPTGRSNLIPFLGPSNPVRIPSGPHRETSRMQPRLGRLVWGLFILPNRHVSRISRPRIVSPRAPRAAVSPRPSRYL